MNTPHINQKTSSVKKFDAKYQDLMGKMQEQAEKEGAIFLPNMEPKKPADYIFICMEPSIGLWAKTIEEGKEKVGAGFRNFTSSIEDFILHFCVQQYLCKTNQTYLFTDVSKGAMTVKLANEARTDRYKRWHKLLLSELELVAAPGAKIFAVGKDVADHLEGAAFPYPVKKIIHYSSKAGKARADGIIGQEKDFDKFLGSVTLDHLLQATKKVFDSTPIMEKFRKSTWDSIGKGKLSESRQKLIFVYKRDFESA